MQSVIYCHTFPAQLVCGQFCFNLEKAIWWLKPLSLLASTKNFRIWSFDENASGGLRFKFSIHHSE